MQRISLTLILFVLTVGTATAQQSTFRYATDPFVGQAQGAQDTATDNSANGTTTAKPESSSYDSYESISSGQSLVQKKAIFRAEQRQLRIAARKWQGYSPSRPTVNANPYMTAYTYSPYSYSYSSSYSPRWSGRTWRPQNSWFGSIWY